MKKALLFFIATTIIGFFSANSQTANAKGDFDFFVIVLDQSKNPISNLEVKIKNEDEELMEKKNTAQDGSIEFRGLFKNKSYHIEFYNYDQRLKNADKIFLKDQFKTEEITKAETGFDYFIFVGDNLSFSELGTRDAREDSPEEKAAKQANTQSIDAIAQNESKNESETTADKTTQKTESSNMNNENVAINSTTENNPANKNTSEKVTENPVENSPEKIASNEPKKEEVVSVTNLESEKQAQENSEPISPFAVTTENTIEKTIKEDAQKTASVSAEETNKTSNNKINEDSKTESNAIASNTNNKKEEATTTLIDFSSLKDKDFNSPETHALLIEEESKITSKKIQYKIQIGAYTNQEMANLVKLSGFGAVDKQNYPDGFTRITVGNCKSLKEAEDLRKKIIAKGINGAWIVGFFENKRYTMKELVTNNFFQ
jgi:hypothetical protein